MAQKVGGIIELAAGEPTGIHDVIGARQGRCCRGVKPNATKLTK